MAKELFRKKSVKKIESPESLNDYVRVSTPKVWILLIGVIVILLGFIVWGVFGKIETKVSAEAVFQNKQAVITLDSKEAIKTDMKVLIDDKEGKVTAVKYEGNSCMVTVSANIGDGKYDVNIVTETISPITFAIN